MNTVEKMNVIQDLNKQKEEVDFQLSELQRIKGEHVPKVSINGSKSIEVDIVTAHAIWNTLNDMLRKRGDKLIERAAELMK